MIESASQWSLLKNPRKRRCDQTVPQEITKLDLTACFQSVGWCLYSSKEAPLIASKTVASVPDIEISQIRTVSIVSWEHLLRREEREWSCLFVRDDRIEDIDRVKFRETHLENSLPTSLLHSERSINFGV